MSEFSRRVDIFVYKDEPRSEEDFARSLVGGVKATTFRSKYESYMNSFQPYRWNAKAANSEIVAQGESYFELAGVVNAINLLFGDDTTVWWMPEFGEDRGESWLRYGVTDRNAQGDDSPEQAD